MHFFTEQRPHFFRPLVSRHRERVVGCLKAFHDRLYSPDVGEAYHVERHELRELFAAALREYPPTPDDDTALPDSDLPEDADEYGLASALIRLLLRDRWIEEYLDKSTMVSAYRFTRAGKNVTKAFIAMEDRTIDVRQRNVRNTRNALAAFAEDGDPYNLADAHAHSLAIIEDLADEIADLDDRKQAMLRNAAGRATVAEFLDYMENHFQPELAVKLAADSVERHRRTILDLVDRIRDWPEADRAAADARLRPLIPRHMPLGRDDSPSLYLLGRIEQAIDTAYHGKLVELRAALAGFSRAATQLIRQQSALRGGLASQDISRLMEHLADAGDGEQDRLLGRLAGGLALPRVGLPDPGAMHLRRSQERRPPTTTDEWAAPSRDEQLQVVMDQAESTAFAVSPLGIRDYLLERIGGGESIRLSQLQPADPPSLLNIMHAIEAASVSLSDQGERLEVIELTETFETPYMTADDFLIRKAP